MLLIRHDEEDVEGGLPGRQTQCLQQARQGGGSDPGTADELATVYGG